MGIVAALMEMMVVRPLVGEPILALIMVTVGLANVLRGLTGVIWGYEELQFPNPFPDDPISNPSARHMNQAGILDTIVATIVLVVVFSCSSSNTASTGISMRATAEDTTTAFLMGINVKRVFTGSWVIAAVVGSVAGVFPGKFYVA
jgi:branched-chain amino acid transport system permease protein